jgi:hypothetical protein
MTTVKHSILIAIGVALALLPTPSAAELVRPTFPVPKAPWAPLDYPCTRIRQAPVIDGLLGEPEWERAPWTEEFVDIEGDRKPAPRYRTRVKMLWDADYFYIAAELEEPHLWATLTDRDAVIYHDNDFEVFIDPDGDTHEYYELEINALGTEWDLFLVKPYRDGGSALNAWDIQGLKSAVSIDGTLNDPGDTDGGWIVEIAIPWRVLAESAHRAAPPEPGDSWRVNFSRVQWQLRSQRGEYAKKINPATRKAYPEDNWVWSPQGLVNMHYPERWGFVHFGEDGAREVEGATDVLARAWQMLRVLYYKQKGYHSVNDSYALHLRKLAELPPAIEAAEWAAIMARCRLVGNDHHYTIWREWRDGQRLYISADGRTWIEGSSGD